MYALSNSVSRVSGAEVREVLADAKRPGMLSLAGGLPAQSCFDIDGIRTASEEALRDHPVLALQYGTTNGQESLLVELQQLMARRDVRVDQDAIVVTAGSQQALDLICRALVNPGDRVLVEDPTYLSALQAFQLAGARLEPFLADGEALTSRFDAKDPQQVRPVFCYVVPNFANPTGAVMPLAQRLDLLRWAVDNQVLIVEDDPYGELFTTEPPPPSLRALAQEIPGAERCVIYLSTFSKTIAPGLRVGWAVLPPELVEPITRVKQAADIHSSALSQEVVARYLRLGLLEKHLQGVRGYYARQCQQLADELRRQLGSEIVLNAPSGGIFLWARLASGTSTRQLLKTSRDQGVIFVPGAAFAVNSNLDSHMRISFANVPTAQITEAVQRLAHSLALCAGAHGNGVASAVVAENAHMAA